MTDVAVFYDDLQESAADFTNAATNLQPDVVNLLGDDTGVGAPAGRHELKSEMNRRLDRLHDATAAQGESASALAASVSEIASSYARLDAELSGEGAP